MTPRTIGLLILGLGAIAPAFSGPTEDALRIGEEALAAGDRTSAATTWVNAFNERATAETATDETCAKLLENAGKLFMEDGNASTALGIYEKLLPLRQRLSGTQSIEAAKVAVRVAELTVVNGGDTSRAERLAKEAVAVFQDAGPEYAQEELEARMNVAYAMMGRKDRINAQAAYLEALEFGKGREGVDQRLVGTCYWMLADIASFFGRTKDARTYAKRRVEFLKQAVGANSPDYYLATRQYGNLMPTAERIPYFHSLLSEVKSAKVSQASSTHRSILSNQLGLTEFNGGDREKGIALFEDAAKYGEKAYGTTDGRLLSIYLNLAKMHLVMNHYDQGVAAYRKVLTIRTKALGPEHEDTIETQKMLDDLLAQLAKIRG